jgi:hypothetical protein
MTPPERKSLAAEFIRDGLVFKLTSYLIVSYPPALKPTSLDRQVIP